MLTRGQVFHQYGFAGYYAEPYHVLMLADQYPMEGRYQYATYYQATLNPAIPTAVTRAGLRPYVGMDPSDPGTWTRPMVPTTGMFGRLHDDMAAANGREGKVRRG